VFFSLMDRRLFLAALGTTSTAALAGCLSVTNTTSGEADISVRAAEVSGRQLNNNGWQKVAELEQKVLALTLRCTVTPHSMKTGRCAGGFVKGLWGSLMQL
jgi:hypothetical protein